MDGGGQGRIDPRTVSQSHEPHCSSPPCGTSPRNCVERGRRVEYRKLNAKGNDGSLDPELRKAITRFKPEAVVVVEPGEYRVEQLLKRVAAALDVRLEIRPDRHFFCSRAEFAGWAKAHGQLRMEFFYRDMRKKSGILMERAKPEGERWNFDAENRKSFGKAGPGMLLATPRSFPPDSHHARSARSGRENVFQTIRDLSSISISPSQQRTRRSHFPTSLRIASRISARTRTPCGRMNRICFIRAFRP